MLKPNVVYKAPELTPKVVTSEQSDGEKEEVIPRASSTGLCRKHQREPSSAVDPKVKTIFLL